MVLVGPNFFQVGPPFFFIHAVVFPVLTIFKILCSILYPSGEVLSPRARPVFSYGLVVREEISRRGRFVMAVSKVFVFVLTVLAVVFTVLSPSVRAQSISPAPAPVSDGTSVDQGIAYGLMLAALVLTYLIHPMDASPFGLF